MTSMARARLGSRRMKPRSSSAVIRRWIPDFERRSSASFISSKEGGTPASFSRSLMKRRSSYCLRVSISTSPQVGGAVRFRDMEPKTFGPDSDLQASTLETNHERTLYVPYVFRNHLISGERDRSWVDAAANSSGSRRMSQGEPAAAAGANGGRITSASCRSEIPQQRAVLMVDRRRDQDAVGALLEPGAQIVLALVVGGDIAPEQRRLVA